MSDDFDFDPNDLFDDFDDDDDFGNVIDDDGLDDFGDDDFGGDDFNDFDDFGDDDFDDFDEDEFGSQLDFLDDEDTDEFDDEFAEPVAEPQDNSFRNLMIGIVAFTLLIVVIFVGLFAFQNVQRTGERNERNTQVAEIEQTNDARRTEIAQMGTDAVINQMTADAGLTQTAQAEEEAEAATSQAEISGSATALIVNQTATQEAIEQQSIDATATSLQATSDAEAANQQATVDSDAQLQEGATQTAMAIEQTLNPPTSTPDPNSTMPTSEGGVSIGSVQQTATALADLFNATPTPNATQAPDLGSGGGAGGTEIAANTPDPGSGGGGTGNEALPDTGIIDDVFGGNPMLVILLAFGLLGVIIVSRGLRSVNKES